MKIATSISTVAAMLLAANAVSAAGVDANKSKATAQPAQKHTRAVNVMTPEQAKAALGRGSCTSRCVAN